MPSSVKRGIKRSLQHVAAKFGRHTRSNHEPQLLTLMYHRVLPADNEGVKIEESRMSATPEHFILHLNIIMHLFVINLSHWIIRKNNGAALPSPACTITFDDGWADKHEFAFPTLR